MKHRPLKHLPLKHLLLTALITLGITLPASAEIDFDSLKGKVIYIDFWASWCGPCRASFPWMNEMHSKYADQGLEIIAVNLDQEPELAQAFLQEMTPAFRIEMDGGPELAEQFGVDTMPTSYIIDRDGKARARHKGFHDGKRATYEQELVELLSTGDQP